MIKAQHGLERNPSRLRVKRESAKKCLAFAKFKVKRGCPWQTFSVSFEILGH
jgi:hypothetical protein